jgi:hypothetical protein
MVKTKAVAASAAFFLSAFLLTNLCHAQQQKSRAASSDGAVTEESLRHVAGAYLEIVQIQRTLSEDLEANRDDHEAQQRLRERASRDMLKAIENEGLDAEEYSNVMKRIHLDDDLYLKFMDIVEKMRRM